AGARGRARAGGEAARDARARRGIAPRLRRPGGARALPDPGAGEAPGAEGAPARDRVRSPWGPPRARDDTRHDRSLRHDLVQAHEQRNASPGRDVDVRGRRTVVSLDVDATHAWGAPPRR